MVLVAETKLLRPKAVHCCGNNVGTAPTLSRTKLSVHGILDQHPPQTTFKTSHIPSNREHAALNKVRWGLLGELLSLLFREG